MERHPLTVSLQKDNMMQGQGHPLGVNGAQDLGSCSPQQRLPVVQGVVSQLRWVLGSRHPLHLYHLSEKERPCLWGILHQSCNHLGNPQALSQLLKPSMANRTHNVYFRHQPLCTSLSSASQEALLLLEGETGRRKRV